MTYRFSGKERRLALGVYPTATLKDAREKRDAARKLLANEIDPSVERRIPKAGRIERAANRFETVAGEWLAKRSPNMADSRSSRVLRALERDVFPWAGTRPVAEVLTITDRRQDPDAPAARVQDLPPEWRTFADRVRASYGPEGPAEPRPEGAT
jgi:hypothetical protein